MATLYKKFRSEDQTVWIEEQYFTLSNLNVTVLYSAIALLLYFDS